MLKFYAYFCDIKIDDILECIPYEIVIASASVLIAAAVSNLHRRTIPNETVIAVMVLFPLAACWAASLEPA